MVVYGRRPVLEALADPTVAVERVLIDRSVRGAFADEVAARCAARGIPCERVASARVGRASGNPRQDQGVVADVLAPGVAELEDWLGAGRERDVPLFLLDGVSNPSNVGMVLRVAVAAGMGATVLPAAGVPDVGSLVAKASAGVAFRATVLRCGTAVTGARALAAAGWHVAVLESGGPSLWTAEWPSRTAFVLGNETTGPSPEVVALASSTLAVPLEGGVESLNVATAAAVVAFEVQRRRSAR